MATVSVPNTATLLVTENLYRQSLTINNTDAALFVYIMAGRNGTPTTSSFDYRISPGNAISVTTLTDGDRIVQDSWRAIASAAGPVAVGVFEGEDIRRQKSLAFFAAPAPALQLTNSNTLSASSNKLQVTGLTLDRDKIYYVTGAGATSSAASTLSFGVNDHTTDDMSYASVIGGVVAGASNATGTWTASATRQWWRFSIWMTINYDPTDGVTIFNTTGTWQGQLADGTSAVDYYTGGWEYQLGVDVTTVEVRSSAANKLSAFSKLAVYRLL